ncbi:insecticidal delta-endotoxin Cry8Ea1 family protein [Bacillus toyonensis]|uniref:insecticidal delta-endotoxin Cry8Ea1 family protein n=1 Tax=Bacillus toyonensis TaxID=155322 RepID=UPI002B44C8A1
MQKKMNDNVEQCVGQWNARNVLQSRITDFDVYNAIIERDYQFLLKEFESKPDYDEAGYILTKNILSGLIGVTGAVVGVLASGGTALFAGVALSLVSLAAGTYFDFSGPSATASAVWENIKEYTENYVENKINEDTYKNLKQELNGCARVIKLYLNYIDIKQYNGSIAEEYCRNALVYLEGRTEMFKHDTYKVLLLPLYVQFMRLHLLLYRDLVLFGEFWGVTLEVRDKDKKKLKELIKEYTEYAHTTYLEGLKKKQSVENPTWKSKCCGVDQNTVLQQQVLPLTKQWNTINRYKQGMQLSVLDIVAQFPTIDPVDYRIGTNLKQSREVYSSIIGAIIKPKDNIGTTTTPTIVNSAKEIDKILAATNKYEGELIDVRIEEGDIKQWKLSGEPYNLKAISKIQSYVDKMTDIAMMKEYNTKLPVSNVTKTWFPSSYMMPLDIVGACCEQANGLVDYFYGGSSLDAIPSDKIKCNIILKNHKLSSVHLFGKFNTEREVSVAPSESMVSTGLICGFRQRELDPKHIVSPNLITQIPAEMNRNEGIKGFKSLPEDITAQNTMYATTGGSYLEYDIFGFENVTYDCKIRLYLSYKGNAGSSISIQVDGEDKGRIMLQPTEQNPNAIKGSKGSYILTEEIDLTFEKEKNIIKLVYNSNGKNSVCIDRVEIVPVKTKTMIGDKKGQIIFTTHSDGTLEATVMNKGPISDSSSVWRVYVGGQDTGFSFKGDNDAAYIAMTFNQEFFEKTDKYKIPGITLNVIEFTQKLISIGNIPIDKDKKKMLELVKVDAQKNTQIIMRKMEGADLTQKIEKNYNIFAGGKLVYQCKKGTKFKTVMDAFNALNIRAFNARIREDNEEMNPTEIADDIINNLFQSLPSPGEGTVKPNVSSYDTRVAKNALRWCKRTNKKLPVWGTMNLNDAEILAFNKESQMKDACYTNEDQLDDMIIRKTSKNCKLEGEK